MNRLRDVGFEHAGHWRLELGKLTLELAQYAGHRNVIYAFVCDGQIMYIGKTNRTLSERMANYRTPGAKQSTNINNHRRIKELLEDDAAVDILVLRDSGLLHYGQFHLNVAAGLEDSLIRIIDPPWNGGKKEIGELTAAAVAEATTTGADDVLVTVEPSPDDQLPQDLAANVGDALAAAGHDQGGGTAAEMPPVSPMRRFTFVLQPTYYSRGFFNVAKKADELIGPDGEVIEIYLGTASVPVKGRISRRDNKNGTPRILVGNGLQRWFASAASVMQEVTVEVISLTSIRLRVADRPELALGVGVAG